MIQKAQKILDINEDVLEEFHDIQDPYNPQNTITGIKCRQSTHLYGALLIFEVNGHDTKPQLIYGMPKINYPFSTNDLTGERIYNWPLFVKARYYTKLDGTNIVNYSYSDHLGQRFSTFKTRLTPVLTANQFGDFKALWDDVLKVYPSLRFPKEVLDGKVALSYELYGYRNPHLIVYNVPIDTKLLCGIKQDNAAIIPPQQFPDIPCILDIQAEAGSADDLGKLYEQLEQDATQSTTKREEDGMLEGTEGYVLYVLTDQMDSYKKWTPFKIKGDDVKDIHWASGAITTASILTTTWNALESCTIDALNEEYVITLLKEEFNDQQIGKSEIRIGKCIAQVRENVYLRMNIQRYYDERSKDLEEGKRHLMRYMSQFFGKKEMKKVFTVMRVLGLVE